MINLAATWKQQMEQGVYSLLCYIYVLTCIVLITADFQRFFQNKIVDLLAQLVQVQLDEANNTIGKLSRMVNCTLIET